MTMYCACLGFHFTPGSIYSNMNVNVLQNLFALIMLQDERVLQILMRFDGDVTQEVQCII